MKTSADNTPILTLDLIRTIIIREMELDQEQVNIYNQKFKIPTDDGLFVVVGYKGSPKIISVRNSQIDIAGEYTEVQDVSTQELIFVSIYSRSIEALQRKEEILMAINSLYSQAMQESHSFRINRISPIDDLSELEGSAMLYRFEVSLVCFTWYQKKKTADYFDTFTTELSTDNNSAIPISTDDPQRLISETGSVLLSEAGYPLSTE